MGEITAKTYTKARVVGYTGSIGTGIVLFLFLFFSKGISCILKFMY
jgi:hypothetical protein